MLFLSPKQQSNINRYSPGRLVQQSRRLLVHWLSLSRSFPLFSTHTACFFLRVDPSRFSAQYILQSLKPPLGRRGFAFDYLLAPTDGSQRCFSLRFVSSFLKPLFNDLLLSLSLFFFLSRFFNQQFARIYDYPGTTP